MPAFKLSMLFNYISGGENPKSAIRQGGTSESIYWDDATDSTVRFFNRLAEKRSALLPKYCAVVGIRVQQVDPVGSARSIDAFYPGGSDVGGQVDIPQLALKFRVKGVGVTNATTRKLAMVPDRQVTDGEYRPLAKYRDALKSYLRSLAFWKFRGLNLTHVTVPIATVGADGTVTTEADIALAPGQTVGLRGVETAAGAFVTGEFTVDTATSLRVFKVRRWASGACTGGKAKRHEYIYPQFDIPATTPINVGFKKVGRPFGLYRGRQAKRRT